MSPQIATKGEAQRLLHDAEFRLKWNRLYERCPWATVFQDVQYLTIWNRNYKDGCELILVYEADESGELKGLFPLSSCPITEKLFVAGDYHCEYQTWLATKECGNEFILRALELLKHEFPKRKLQMVFLAPDTPLDWLDGKWAKQSVLRSVPRPMVDLGDKDKPDNSLRKRGNKTRTRQLEKIGDLRFEELSSSKELSEIFDEIENFSHLRLSAIHNVQSKIDKNRKQFHIDLMEETDVVYSTVLSVDEKIASAQVCFRNKDEMLLCITSMSPFFAKQSPSKLHLLMLMRELTKTNYTNFDLSPGAGYKERFATHSENCHTLTVFFNKAECTIYKVRRRAVKFARKTLEGLSVTKSRAFTFADKVAHKLRRVNPKTIPSTVLKNLIRRIYDHKECRMYSIDVRKIQTLHKPNLMNRNSVSDLLKFRPVEGWQTTTSKFHQKVLENFENGIHSYSYVEGNTLLHYGWLIERQKISNVFEVEQEFELPPDTPVLFDYYTHPNARGKGFVSTITTPGPSRRRKCTRDQEGFYGCYVR